MNKETRSHKGGVKVEARENGGKVAQGYAAVYYRADDPGTQYQLWEDCYERIMPGAFDRALREKQDVRCLFNHEADHVLGRTASQTLTLRVDGTGLWYECSLPESRADVAESIKRGDVDGSSFSFVPRETVWRDVVENGRNVTYREISDVDLIDVSPVTFPAYEAATVNMRNNDGLKSELENRRQARNAIAERLKMVESVIG